MAGETPSAETLLAKIKAYEEYIAKGSADQHTADDMIGELDELVPHAAISDLMFYGERERTPQEVVDEALVREDILRSHGELSLLLHIRSQMEEGLKDDTLKAVHRNYARRTLDAVTAKIQAMRLGSSH